MTTDGKEVREALEDAHEFIEGYADVRDGYDGIPEPNKAMIILASIERALGISRDESA